MSEPSDETHTASILPGAEPISIVGGATGVLVIHGFTSSPHAMKTVASALGDAGFTVEAPLLPGHGTELAEMLTTDWSDWSTAADEAYAALAARTERVFVAGLSMGGTITLWLAEQHSEVAGIILVNPACPPPGSGAEVLAGLEAMIDAGETLMDAIGSDIADPDASELAYGQTPLAPLVSLFRNGEDVAAAIGSIECPALLLTSPQDHVVPTEHGDYVAENLGGDVERVSLERSYHVATMDFDKDLIAERAVAFVQAQVEAGTSV
jgi:carboxylesterase